MPKGTSKSTAIIQRLLEERRQYEAWIARLNDSADASPGHVRAAGPGDRKRQELDAAGGKKPHVGSTPPPKPQPHARPTPQKVGHEDELAFIKSVTEDDDAAPSARRASGAQFQPVVPADMPRAQPPSAPRAANPSPAPVLPEASDSAGDEQADKTLKCKECGTMNRPTEWYCQQCGAELAAF